MEQEDAGREKGIKKNTFFRILLESFLSVFSFLPLLLLLPLLPLPLLSSSNIEIRLQDV